jgi:hypothetical protein
MTQGPGPYPLEQDERFGTITGSVVRDVTDRRDLEALLSIFQLRRKPDAKLQEQFDTGHAEEEPTAVFYIAERKKRENETIVLTHPRFRRHPDLPFLGGTGDREVRDKNAGVQMKFRAGATRNDPVGLHRAGCAKDSKCQCHMRCKEIDQCCLEMLVYDWVRNDLAARSNVDGDYVKIDRSCLDIWLPIAMPILREFYERYLKWYWTDVRTPELTNPLREKLTEYFARPENADRKVDVEARVFARRPQDLLLIKKAREIPPLPAPDAPASHKRKADADDDPPKEKEKEKEREKEDEAKVSAFPPIDRLSAKLIDKISIYAGRDISPALPAEARYWQEVLRDRLGLKRESNQMSQPELLAAVGTFFLSASSTQAKLKADAHFFTRILEEATPKMIAMAASGRTPLPFCVHGQTVIPKFRKDSHVTDCECQKGTLAGPL